MSKQTAQGSPDGPKYIYGKENVNWAGPKQASSREIDAAKEDFNKNMQQHQAAYEMLDVDYLKETLVGRKISHLETRYGQANLVLDNGDKLSISAQESERAYAFLEFHDKIGDLDNAITDVRVENSEGTEASGWATVHILADMNEVFGFDAEWDEGNGYYMYGFNVDVDPYIIPPSHQEYEEKQRAIDEKREARRDELSTLRRYADNLIENPDENYSDDYHIAKHDAIISRINSAVTHYDSSLKENLLNTVYAYNTAYDSYGENPTDSQQGQLDGALEFIKYVDNLVSNNQK